MFQARTDIDWSRLTPMHNTHFPNDVDREHILTLAQRAEEYLLRFDWCRGIGDGSGIVEGGRWYGTGIDRYVGIFLLEAVVDPRWKGLDTWTWVIVGDVPPARISPWYARNPYQAINSYAGEMQAWVDAVRQGLSIDELIPVNVAPSREFADMLATRLELINKFLIEPNRRLLDAPAASDRESTPKATGPESQLE